jgi:hypothetical protein
MVFQQPETGMDSEMILAGVGGSEWQNAIEFLDGNGFFSRQRIAKEK